MNPDYALFAKIVEAGSLSAAARALAISPAMVSKRLARLEDGLGVRLVHRTTRRLVLTDAGERFHADLAAIIAALKEAENRLTGARDDPAGPLRLSAPTSFGRLHLTPRLHLFLTRHPLVQLELDLSDDYVDLIGERYDLAIRVASEVPASLTAHPLGSNRRVLCASGDYLAAHGVPTEVAALTRHRLLAARGQLPWRLSDGRRRRVVEGHSHVATNSSEVVRELAISGVGIALRSLWDVHDALRDGRLTRILPDWESPTDLGIMAVHPRSPVIGTAVTAMVAFLKDSLAVADWDIPG